MAGWLLNVWQIGRVGDLHLDDAAREVALIASEETVSPEVHSGS